MRLIVLIAVSTGMRSTEIHRLRWSDVMYSEGLLAVRARLKNGKVRYDPHAVGAVRGNSAISCGDRSGSDFSAEGRRTSRRHRLEGSFQDLLYRAKIHDFSFHDLRHTFASWYMMNGGDLYEQAKLLAHANISMTERYTKLGRAHITKTGNTAKVIGSMLDKKKPEQEEGGQEDVA
jgi:integrase